MHHGVCMYVYHDSILKIVLINIQIPREDMGSMAETNECMHMHLYMYKHVCMYVCRYVICMYV